MNDFQKNIKFKLLIIVPTYNEADNIQNLIQAIHSSGLTSAFEILVVDDGSPDGTGALVEGMKKQFSNVHLLQRTRKEGLGPAYIAAFRWAFERNYDWIIQMDADFSHDPMYLPDVEKMIKLGQYDYLVGSRYMKGGGTQNWGFIRRLISRCGNAYAQFFLGPFIDDFTGGFNAWRSGVLRDINFHSIISDGYAFLTELKYRAFKRGFRVGEFPIVFVDRRGGVSKLSKKIILNAVISVILFRVKIK